jgi:hypothetical protein
MAAIFIPNRSFRLNINIILNFNCFTLCMKERDGGIGAIIGVMAVITVVYAFLAGYVHLPKHLPDWMQAEASAQHLPLSFKP